MSGATPVADSPPWAATPESVLERLRSDSAGLSAAEAARRLRRHGPNLLRATRARSAWAILLAQIANLIVAVLAVAAGVALAFGHTAEGVAVLAVLSLNAAIGFAMELRATRSMEALRELGRVHATVRRGGELAVVTADGLVPGDVISVETGDVITTDARILESNRLAADESILTGESQPISKSARAAPAHAHLAERTSMLFKGTTVTRGSGEAVVVATGMGSELGQIAKLVEETEEEETPLEQRLSLLGRRLVWLTAVIALLVAGMGVIRGQDLVLVVSTAVALAIATVPEGLPVVATLALARGMWKMARRNTLVRRLSAVETLGSTGVVMTDKTGTLTENHLTVVRAVVDGASFEREPGGPFTNAEGPARELLNRALSIGVLCNNGDLAEDGSGVGDPLEVALLEAAAVSGVDPDLARTLPEVREEPFDPETRMMATFHASDGDAAKPLLLVAVKGAAEPVIERCTHVATASGVAPLDDRSRERWRNAHDELATAGLRVLALAERQAHDAAELPFEGLALVGLVGMHDPPRRDVGDVIEQCRRAGLRIVMVTGDHPRTARCVAEAVGLGGGDVSVASGEDFVDPTAAPRLLETTIFARTSPRQKLALIRAHQDAGAVVAMIGDGVNDAPALRRADIGVAMGKRGTEVAKEAADMVLLDDRLESIVVAVREGRTIFDNIRRFVVYLLSCNVSELLSVGAASLAGLPLPVLPMQILFLNLVTDVFPALALGACPPEADVMTRPPRQASEQTLTRAHWHAIGAYGVVLMVAVLASLWVALRVLGFPERQAVTVSFLTLGVAQTLHVFNMRSGRSARLSNEVTRNPWVWGALALCGVLMAAAVFLPVLGDLLATENPGPSGWLLVAGMALLPLLAGEVGKHAAKLRRPVT